MMTYQKDDRVRVVATKDRLIEQHIPLRVARRLVGAEYVVVYSASSSSVSVRDPDEKGEVWYMRVEDVAPYTEGEAANTSTDLEEFKKDLVNRAFKIAKEHDFCSESVETVVRELGLPLEPHKKTIKVEIQLEDTDRNYLEDMHDDVVYDLRQIRNTDTVKAVIIDDGEED